MRDGIRDVMELKIEEHPPTGCDQLPNQTRTLSSKKLQPDLVKASDIAHLACT